MARSSRGSGKRRHRSRPRIPHIKELRPISWYSREHPTYYIEHALKELGRLDIDTERSFPSFTVLDELMAWLSNHPGKEYADLMDWYRLNLDQMTKRRNADRNAKPRIEITAEISKQRNLLVRWYPHGWHKRAYDWNNREGGWGNLIDQYLWPENPDFRVFFGDEPASIHSRASNELMFIRDVEHLATEPREHYGAHATFNNDVLSSILICAVRAAYEGLIESLRHSFEVTVVHSFDFTLRDEYPEDDPYISHPTRRVVEWTLDRTEVVEARRAKVAKQRQEKKDAADFESLEETHGFTAERFVEALVEAATPGKRGAVPKDDQINTIAGRILRNAGADKRFNATHVRRLRALIEKFRPELMPEQLRMPQPEESTPKDSADVIQFRKSDS